MRCQNRRIYRATKCALSGSLETLEQENEQQPRRIEGTGSNVSIVPAEIEEQIACIVLNSFPGMVQDEGRS